MALFSYSILLFWLISCLHIPSKFFCLIFRSFNYLFRLEVGSYKTSLSYFQLGQLWLTFLLIVLRRFLLLRLKLSFLYTFYPYQCRILLKPYMFSCLIKEEKLLCLKYFGKTVSVNRFISLMMNASSEDVQSIQSKHVSSYINKIFTQSILQSFSINWGTPAILDVLLAFPIYIKY